MMTIIPSRAAPYVPHRLHLVINLVLGDGERGDGRMGLCIVARWRDSTSRSKNAVFRVRIISSMYTTLKI